ncbi:MAG: beta-lactamase family protein [Bacteroidales bacterium]|nr:beta-lactamase family protein [Bacteroidales bacterium]
MKSVSLRKFWLSAAVLLTAFACAHAYNDGLPRSTPEAEGVNSEYIAKFFSDLDKSGLEVHSIMIIRHGKVIAEHWWAPYAPEYTHAMYSCTKTFTATAIGFAVQEGLLKVSDKVISFFPDLLPDVISEDLANLTVEHLLSMSVGHKSTSYAGSGLPQVKSFLAAEFQYHPGTHFAYNISASHMLSNIITRVTGLSIKEYLEPRLFEPLGIKDIVWEMDDDGHNMGNGGSHLRTSDMAKFGIFLMNKGKYNGKQLLNPEWIETGTRPHIYQKDPNGPEKDAKDDGGQGYGYQCWMGRNGSYRAIGAMNQVILVFPDKDFAVISTGAVRDETTFNDLCYAMLPGVGDKKLKASKTNLEQAIACYALKKPFEPAAPQAKSETRKFRMFQNQYGIEKVDFRFDAQGNCQVTFETAASNTNLDFGVTDWKIRQTDRKMALTRSSYPNTADVTPYYSAGMCSWTAKDQLSAQSLSFFNAGATENFRFTFDGDKLKMEILGSGPNASNALLEGVNCK